MSRQPVGSPLARSSWVAKPALATAASSRPNVLDGRLHGRVDGIVIGGIADKRQQLGWTVEVLAEALETTAVASSNGHAAATGEQFSGCRGSDAA
jgi:hypothetical protein